MGRPVSGALLPGGLFARRRCIGSPRGSRRAPDPESPPSRRPPGFCQEAGASHRPFCSKSYFNNNRKHVQNPDVRSRRPRETSEPEWLVFCSALPAPPPPLPPARSAPSALGTGGGRLSLDAAALRARGRASDLSASLSPRLPGRRCPFPVTLEGHRARGGMVQRPAVPSLPTRGPAPLQAPGRRPRRSPVPSWPGAARRPGRQRAPSVQESSPAGQGEAAGPSSPAGVSCSQRK